MIKRWWWWCRWNKWNNIFLRWNSANSSAMDHCMIGGAPWAQRESVHASLRVYIHFRSSACFFFIIAIFRMDVYRSRSYNFISIVVHPSQHACSAASTNLSLINTLSLFFFFTFFSLSIYRIFTIIVSLSLTFLLKYYLERILFDFNSWMKMWIAHAFHAS